jgi:hypothetical protein
MPKQDPKADQYLAKAKRFRDRAAGFRHTLARKDLTRAHREELSTMAANLEGAARQLEAMAGGSVPIEPATTAAEEIRKLRATGKIDPRRSQLLQNVQNMRNARVAAQVLNAVVRSSAKAPAGTAAARPAGGLPPRKRGA